MKAIRLAPQFTIPTPFGKIQAPNLELPSLTAPKLDDRGKQALLHAIGSDASTILGIIPYVGGLAADVVEDMHLAEIRNLLTENQYRRFMEYTKVGPDVIAVWRSLQKEE